MPKVCEKEVLGRCPHQGCGGLVVKDITGAILNLPQPYCERCGTVFKFVPAQKNSQVQKAGRP